jgi:hypothetical protein
MVSVAPYCWSSGVSKENRLASGPVFGGEAKTRRASMATGGEGSGFLFTVQPRLSRSCCLVAKKRGGRA